MVPVITFLFYRMYVVYFFFFFFQAEDGIRDLIVTGVQTCALPIWGMVLEDLCDDLTTLAEVVQREPEDLVIRAAQHAAVAVGLGGLAPLGFPHEAELVDLIDGEAERRVALLHDERVAPEPDEMQLPEDPAVVERDLP